MKKYYSLFIILLFRLNLIIAQNTYAINPEATSISKFIEYPISYYTGILEISISIYKIKSQEFPIPISPNYHAKGILFCQLASNVGLG